MKAQIIQIGNSQGIRIPKMMLEETKISGEVELEMRSDGILIRQANKPRAGWDKLFKSLEEHDDDAAADDDHATGFDEKKWQW